MNDQEIEKEIKTKGLTDARITPEGVEASIALESYFTAAEGHAKAYNCPMEDVPDQLNILTFCVLILRNGYTVTGESSCVSPKNFDAEIGKKIARENAKQKIWQLEGYLLKQRLFEND